MKWVLTFAALLCAASAQVINVDTVPWWRRAIFYQVYPRSFKDSNGDGLGDLNGVAEKAQYFKDIGVDAIWLSPFYNSPMRDFGYDISNFTGVDPMFGTIDDFRNLSRTLSKLGVKLVIDYVPNHSSDLHPWFELSCNRTDPYTDFYVWDDGRKFGDVILPPNNWMSVFGGSAWEWHKGRKQFYYHAFLKEQPDLNYNNPALRATMEEVMRYWLNLGVDGFRLDSANYMFESDDRTLNETALPGTSGLKWKDYNHNLTQNQNKTYQLFGDWANRILYNYTTAKGGKARALFLEVYTDLNNTLKYYGTGNTSLMLPFNFELLVHANQSSRSPWIKEIVDTWLDNMPDDGVANWVVGNHDNGRVADRYGYEMVDAINLLTGILPGIKVTYYGAELGMTNTFVRWDQNVDPSGKSLGPYHYMEASRDPERTPMQWDGTISAGFSKNGTPWLPVNPNYWWLNVQQQTKAEWSHLKVFEALAKARRDPVLLAGNCTVLTPDDDTLVVLRNYNGSYITLLINMGSEYRVYNSNYLTMTMPSNLTFEVIITSINVAEHQIGDRMLSNSLSIQLRPKGAIVLRSLKSSAARLFLSIPLLLLVALSNL